MKTLTISEFKSLCAEKEYTEISYHIDNNIDSVKNAERQYPFCYVNMLFDTVIVHSFAPFDCVCLKNESGCVTLYCIQKIEMGETTIIGDEVTIFCNDGNGGSIAYTFVMR